MYQQQSLQQLLETEQQYLSQLQDKGCKEPTKQVRQQQRRQPLPANYVQFTITDKKDHQIDAITGKPKRLALNLLIEALTENAASIPTLKGGGLFGHTAFCMSPAEYATIPNGNSPCRTTLYSGR